MLRRRKKLTKTDKNRQGFELGKSQKRDLGTVKEKINKTLEHRIKLFAKRDTKSGKIVSQNDKKGDVVKKEHENGQNRVPKRERRGSGGKRCRNVS